MRTLLYITALCIAAAMAMVSCSAVGCTENQNSLPLAGFYSMQTGNAISADSIEIGGVDAPDDSLLLKQTSRANQLYLPFRSTKQSTSFYFHYCQKALDYVWLIDTITFDYESVPFFASEDCGAMYHYRVTSYTYTKHIIDSVGMSDSLITNVDRESIQIFFRTDDGEEEDTNS